MQHTGNRKEKKQKKVYCKSIALGCRIQILDVNLYHCYNSYIYTHGHQI